MFTITDLCPICQKRLVPTCGAFYCDTVKSCPDGHYTMEVYPLLDTVIYVEQESSTKGEF